MVNEINGLVEKMNAKTGEEAALAVKAGKKASILRMIFLPPAVFLAEYVFKLNIFKGLSGLKISVLAANHVFVREVKIWEIGSNPKSKIQNLK